MNNTNGKIAEQSRQKLIQGLLCSMKTYPYAEITVTQISQEAGLSRKTFYRLYRSKDELLLHYIDLLITEFVEKIRENHIQHYWDTVLQYFDFWKGHSEFLILLKQNQLLHLFMQKSYENTFHILSITKPHRPNFEQDPYLSYGMAFSVGGVSYMLIKWIEDDMAMEPIKFIDYIHHGLKNSQV